MAETPRLAHLVTLAFLASGLGSVTGLFILFFGFVRKAKLARKLGATVALFCFGGYAVILLATGLASSNKTLPVGSWKYFCEADCHIAYSIASVQTVATLGNESNLSQAGGEFIVVRLKSWFDENSISKFRGDAPLTPVPRIVSLVDASGRRFFPVQLRPAALRDVSTPLAQPLRPGESYLTSFVFDVPKEASELHLLIADDDPISTVLIDQENSPFHGKIYLSLNPPHQSAAQNFQ
jgi:hypothetical protein